MQVCKRKYKYNIQFIRSNIVCIVSHNVRAFSVNIIMKMQKEIKTAASRTGENVIYGICVH